MPALPGCISEGGTLEESLASIREAIPLCLEPLDEEIPEGLELAEGDRPRPHPHGALYPGQNARLILEEFLDLL